jgi:anthranilate phosphoribosyltransferase
LRRLLRGEHGAYRDAVVLNAAVALTLVGEPLDAGARRAAAALDSGAANDLLDRWIAWA